MADGWWNNNGAIAGSVAAYQPIDAASLAASYSNLFNPGTNDAAPGTAPTWNATDGWIFNGTTQYLTTGITPAAGTYSISVRFSNVTGSGGRSLFGVYSISTSGAVVIQVNDSVMDAFNGEIAPGGAGANSPAMSAGVYGFAGKTCYRNGSAEATTIPGASNGNGGAIIIGALENVGFGQANFFPGYIQALAVHNTALTSGEMATLHAAMAALGAAAGQPMARRGVQVPHLAGRVRVTVGGGW